MAKRSKYRHSASGQTLLEALIGLSILSITLVCISQLSSATLNIAKVRRLNTTRDQIVSDLAKLASTPAALRASAGMGGDSNNQMLANCLNNTTSSCNSSMQYDFVLYGPSTNTGVAPGALTGTSTQPLRYRGDGTPCAVANCPPSQYPLQVYTQFRTVCAPPGPTGPGQLMIDTLTPPLTCSASNLSLVLVTIVVQPSPGATPSVAPYQTTIPVKAEIIPYFNWM